MLYKNNTLDTFFRPGTKLIVITSVVCFVLRLFAQDFFDYFLGLNFYNLFYNQMVWQPLSYLFVHGDFAHLFFNMLGISILGNQIEYLWGIKKYLSFFFLCGICAGILSSIYNPNISYIGASASLCGLLFIYAKLYPNRELLLWFLFPIKIKNILLLFILYDALSLIINDFIYETAYNNIAHFAHLMGFLIAFLYIKKNYILNFVKFGLIKLKLASLAESNKSKKINNTKNVELQKILDKIDKLGIQSLTKSEEDIVVNSNEFTNNQKPN